MTKCHLQGSIVSTTLYKDNAGHFGRHLVKNGCHFVHQDGPCFIINNPHKYLTCFKGKKWNPLNIKASTTF